MESYENVLIGTLAVAVLCISFSTWVTLSDLRSVVFEAEGRDGAGRSTDLSFASRAIGHIEHPLQKHTALTISGPGARSQAELAESWGQCYAQNHTECVPFSTAFTRTRAYTAQLIASEMYAVIMARP